MELRIASAIPNSFMNILPYCDLSIFNGILTEFGNFYENCDNFQQMFFCNLCRILWTSEKYEIYSSEIVGFL